MSHRSLENSIRDIMAASAQPAPIEEAVEETPVEEEVEQVEEAKVNELSKSTLGSYVKKASQDAADKAADFGRKDADQKSVQRSLNRHGMSSADHDAVHKAYKTTDSDVRKPEKKAAKRLKGINTAVKKLTKEEEQVKEQNCGCGQNPCKTYGKVEEKTLTPAEKKKREEVAKAIERDNPKMPMDKKMAIATATAKKVAEERIPGLMQRVINKDK